MLSCCHTCSCLCCSALGDETEFAICSDSPTPATGAALFAVATDTESDVLALHCRDTSQHIMSDSSCHCFCSTLQRAYIPHSCPHLSCPLSAEHVASSCFDDLIAHTRMPPPCRLSSRFPSDNSKMRLYTWQPFVITMQPNM